MASFYQRQAAHGKMAEAEFDQMEETEEARRYWEAELTTPGTWTIGRRCKPGWTMPPNY